MQQLSQEDPRVVYTDAARSHANMTEALKQLEAPFSAAFLAEERDNVFVQSVYPYMLSKCDALLSKLKKHPDAWPFLEPGAHRLLALECARIDVFVLEVRLATAAVTLINVLACHLSPCA